MIQQKSAAVMTQGGAKWTELPSLLWRGICMGIAEVIPGVSGGTVALITGVLGRLVDAINSFDASAIKMLLGFRLKDFFARVHWRFFLMLFSGQLLGILLCTKVFQLPHLLRTYPEPMLGLFFGLILASSILLAREAGMPDWRGIVAYLAGALIGISVVAGFRAETPDAPWFIVVCGAVAICAWILPGISGSFMLLLLHKYDFVWESITFGNGMPFFHNLFQIIAPFGVGALLGLALFSRALSWVFKSWPRHTMMTMTGLLITSLWAIFPFQHSTFEVVASGKEKLVGTRPYLPTIDQMGAKQSILAIVLTALGFIAVLWIESYARKKKAGTNG